MIIRFPGWGLITRFETPPCRRTIITGAAVATTTTGVVGGVLAVARGTTPVALLPFHVALPCARDEEEDGTLVAAVEGEAPRVFEVVTGIRCSGSWDGEIPLRLGTTVVGCRDDDDGTGAAVLLPPTVLVVNVDVGLVVPLLPDDGGAAVVALAAAATICGLRPGGGTAVVEVNAERAVPPVLGRRGSGELVGPRADDDAPAAADVVVTPYDGLSSRPLLTLVVVVVELEGAARTGAPANVAVCCCVADDVLFLFLVSASLLLPLLL